MQQIVVEEPYEFIPPHTGRCWPWLLVHFVAERYLRKNYAVRGCEVRGAERLRASLDAGHGVVLTSNHPRPCDPMAASWITRAVRHPFYCMASWHTFLNSKFEKYLMRRCGAFSIHRESTDHKSLNFCVSSVATADRPIIMFAEGLVTRHNDQLAPLLDGAALIARMAAKRRAKLAQPGKVVLHGITYKYFFRGDLEANVVPVLAKLEGRLSLETRPGTTLVDRLAMVAEALMAKHQLDYLGQSPDTSPSPEFDARVLYLLNEILEPLEQEWAADEGPVKSTYQRVQRLRTRLLPDMVAKQITEEERARRWEHLAACYTAQQLGCYPTDYFREPPTPERILEFAERLDEDITDAPAIHGPLDLVISVGDAIEVPPRRERTADGDPIMNQLGEQMSDLIAETNNNPPPPLRGLRLG